jgi:hypothetical protein
MQWVKEHPYLAGALVLGLIILFFVFRRGSARSSSAGSQQTVYAGPAGPSEALQSTQLQTAAQVHAVDTQANVQQSAINAQVAIEQLKQATAVQETQLQTQAQIQNIVTSGQVQLHATDASLAAINAQVGGQVQIADINATRDVNVAGIQADVAKTQYNDALQGQAIISAAQTQQALAHETTAREVAGYSAGVQLAQIGAAKDVALGQENVDLTKILSDADVAKFGISAQKDVALGAENVQSQVVSSEADLYNHLLTNQGMTEQDIYHLVQSGQINKGGAGGQNQVQLLTSLFGKSTAPGAVETSGFSLSIPGVGAFGFGGQG